MFEKRQCAASPAHRKAMQRIWRADKRHFYRYRTHRLYLAAITPPGPAVLAAIKACESGGNYRAVSPDGTYRGAYQFDYGTWASVGGSGDPAAASPHEQDRRAALLYRQRGSSPWPVCGV